MGIVCVSFSMQFPTVEECAFDRQFVFDEYSAVASSIIGGGGGGGGGLIFIYLCSALLISFEIDCFYGL